MELPPGSGLPMMTIVAFAGWPSMAAAQIVRCLEMTARWCGVSVHTASTCIAFSSGLTLSKSSSIVLCADRSGSSKNNQVKISPFLQISHPLLIASWRLILPSSSSSLETLFAHIVLYCIALYILSLPTN